MATSKIRHHILGILATLIVGCAAPNERNNVHTSPEVAEEKAFWQQLVQKCMDAETPGGIRYQCKLDESARKRADGYITGEQYAQMKSRWDTTLRSAGPDFRLYDAAMDGDLLAMREAINQGANVNQVLTHKDRAGKGSSEHAWPLLYLAAKKYRLDSMRVLLENGADPNYRWQVGETAEYPQRDILTDLVSHRVHSLDGSEIYFSGEEVGLLLLEYGYQPTDESLAEIEGSLEFRGTDNNGIRQNLYDAMVKANGGYTLSSRSHIDVSTSENVLPLQAETNRQARERMIEHVAFMAKKTPMQAFSLNPFQFFILGTDLGGSFAKDTNLTINTEIGGVLTKRFERPVWFFENNDQYSEGLLITILGTSRGLVDQLISAENDAFWSGMINVACEINDESIKKQGHKSGHCIKLYENMDTAQNGVFTRAINTVTHSSGPHSSNIQQGIHLLPHAGFIFGVVQYKHEVYIPPGKLTVEAFSKGNPFRTHRDFAVSVIRNSQY